MGVERMLCGLLAAACLVLGVWASILSGQRDLARQDAAAWETSAEKNRAALEDMTAAHAKLQKAFEERERTLASLEQDRERQRAKLREAMRNDGKTRDWGGTVLPSFVDGMLK